MKDFYRILNYVKPYYRYAFLNMIFNVFAVLFSLVSITMVIPFLGLLFGTIETDIIKPESFTFSTSSIKDHFYYEINNIIESGETIDALLFICVLILKQSIQLHFVNFLILFYYFFF